MLQGKHILVITINNSDLEELILEENHSLQNRYEKVVWNNARNKHLEMNDL